MGADDVSHASAPASAPNTADVLRATLGAGPPKPPPALLSAERCGDHSSPRAARQRCLPPFRVCSTSNWPETSATSASDADVARDGPWPTPVVGLHCHPARSTHRERRRRVGHPSVRVSSRSLTSAHLHRSVNEVFTGCSNSSGHHWCRCPVVAEIASRFRDSRGMCCCGDV